MSGFLMEASYVEQEERNPTLETLLRLTGALGVQLEGIIKEGRRASIKSKAK